MTTMKMILTRMLRMRAIPLVDGEHLKRRAHLKRHHLPTSDNTQFLEWQGGCLWWNTKSFHCSCLQPGDQCQGQSGVASMRADVNDVARLEKQLLRNTFEGFEEAAEGEDDLEQGDPGVLKLLWLRLPTVIPLGKSRELSKIYSRQILIPTWVLQANCQSWAPVAEKQTPPGNNSNSRSKNFHCEL